MLTKLQDTDFFAKSDEIAVYLRVQSGGIMQKKLSVVCLLGFMGCGKSTVGKELASLVGAEFTDLDEYVVEREGRSIPDMFRDGEQTFRNAEMAALEDYLTEENASSIRVLALGGGTPTIPGAVELVLERTSSVYLRCNFTTIISRIGIEDPSRPLSSDATRLYASRLPLYERAFLKIDVDGKTPRQIAEEIREALLP